VVPGEKMQDLPIVRQIIVEAIGPIVGFYERIQNKSTVTATIVRYNCQPVLELGMPKTSFCTNSGTIMSLILESLSNWTAYFYMVYYDLVSLNCRIYA
jgi:hypothetical protein